VEREKALEMAMGQIEKQFGKGAIMRMGENSHMQIEAISTGTLSLDLALGIGGLPRGRIVELFGPESSVPATAARRSYRRVRRPGAGIRLGRLQVRLPQRPASQVNPG